MDKVIRPPSRLVGEIVPPGDKSISHRAAIFNAVAEGGARITNFCPGEDCLSTLKCLRALGVTIETVGGVSVTGVGTRGLQEPQEVLDCGNSGTTMRLLSGLLAAHPFLTILTGDASLRSRPMGRVIQPLRTMGAQIWGRREERAPLAIRGAHLHGLDYRLPVASAQVKSALILAGLFAGSETTLEEPAPTRDHTERLLRAMGARVRTEGRRVAVQPLTSPLQALHVAVPGDLSAAAYFLVAAAIHPQAEVRIRRVGINPTRSGILDILRAMGADLAILDQSEVGGEPVADLVVRSSSLRGVEVRGDLIPRAIDELPVIAVAAAAARGETVIRDAAELRVKESDRVHAIAQELSRLGADVCELPDGMVIQGGKKLRGAGCSTYGDHRLAMTLGVAGLVAAGETLVYNAELAEVSYPSFWSDLERLCDNVA